MRYPFRDLVSNNTHVRVGSLFGPSTILAKRFFFEPLRDRGLVLRDRSNRIGEPFLISKAAATDFDGFDSTVDAFSGAVTGF